jgi:hypothetical protein
MPTVFLSYSREAFPSRMGKDDGRSGYGEECTREFEVTPSENIVHD